MNLDRLEKVLSIQSESYKQWRMFAYIVRQLKEIGCKFFVDDGCIYVTKGIASAYPCVVAHMDTVHQIGSDLCVVKVGHKWTGFNRKTMTQTGIGGDDKVGIFIALECLRTFDNIKAVFFRDEETGCEGSYMAKIPFFDDCGYVMQCDRKGNSDFIICASGIELSSYEFQGSIEWILNQYEYKTAFGFMTDVMALKQNGMPVSAANISCGYYNPHEDNEYVNIRDVETCLCLVSDIISYLGNTAFPHVYRKPEPKPKQDTFSKSTKKKKNYYLDLFSDYSRLARSRFESYTKYEPLKEYCECCSERVDSVTFVRDYNMDLCDKCIDDNIPEFRYR